MMKNDEHNRKNANIFTLKHSNHNDFNQNPFPLHICMFSRFSHFISFELANHFGFFTAEILHQKKKHGK